MKAEMVPSASVSPVREILEIRLAQLLPDLESAVDAQIAREVERVTCQVRALVRGELADQLNQAARRIRQADNASEAGATLVDAASSFATSVLLLRIEGSRASTDALCGVPEDRAVGFRNQEIPLEKAPALAEAIRTLDPVTAIATPMEVSAELADLARGSERISIFPVVVNDRVPALLCAWGEVESSAVELLAQVAAIAFRILPMSPDIVPVAGLVQAASPAPAPASSWDALSHQDQQIHLRAQRAARVEAAEIRLYERDGVEDGRKRRDLYNALRSRIDAARESFHKTYFSATPTMVDYLHLELLRTLAHDDPDLLGKDYPGPLA
jgi:hypothetical protein